MDNTATWTLTMDTVITMAAVILPCQGDTLATVLHLHRHKKSAGRHGQDLEMTGNVQIPDYPPDHPPQAITDMTEAEIPSVPMAIDPDPVISNAHLEAETAHQTLIPTFQATGPRKHDETTANREMIGPGTGDLTTDGTIASAKTTGSTMMSIVAADEHAAVVGAQAENEIEIVA